MATASHAEREGGPTTAKAAKGGGCCAIRMKFMPRMGLLGAMTRRMGWADLPADVEAVGQGVLAAAFAVHSAFGPGCLESAYRKALGIALRQAGWAVEEEVWLDLVFMGEAVPRAFRMDLVVDRCVVIEVKAVDTIHPVHTAQLVSYLRMSGLSLGFVLNFHAPHMRLGIHRRVNTQSNWEVRPFANLRGDEVPSRSGEAELKPP